MSRPSVAAVRRLATGDDAARLALLRVLVTGYAVGYLLIRAPHLWDLAALADDAPGRWSPVGPFTFVAEPWPPSAVRALVPLTIVVGLSALLGRAWSITAPAAAVGVLLLTSYASSWGQVFHTENLLVLHLLVLAAAAVVDGGTGARRTGELAPRAMAVVVVVAYVLAGWAKLRASGWGWVSGDALLHHVAHDNLRKVLVGDWYSPIGAWAVGHPWVFRPMAALSLVVELAAPLALLGGRLRRAWVAGAWLFHLGVLAIMAILFPYQLTGVAFAAVLVARPLRPDRPSR
ncbi:hypothetical protein [Actinomarinicola tropica]|uniref:HTTM domain-containing protein n=1 Tax=Actinomarinicola tropica TaxID=2789776 RepID=A0A5Q2RK42_9ACTN|nr:hypothetical protein [Actinomarinicola tropica]QGG96203.1 hypothetical protein GH723_14440 [Actinomarinicola tropica]